MDGSRFDHLARLVSRRSRRQVLGGLAGMATAAFFSQPTGVHAACPSVCGANASCTNESTCECNAGYDGDPDIECIDIDECSLGTDNCDPNAMCTNTSGHFQCACNVGYSGNGETCESDVEPPPPPPQPTGGTSSPPPPPPPKKKKRKKKKKKKKR